MEWYQIIFFFGLFVLLALAIPWLMKYRVWHFASLLLGCILIGYFLGIGLTDPPNHRYGFFLVILLSFGILYRAVRFYRTIK